MMLISIIVSVADNGVIGWQNQLPWHISSDLKRFKRLTMGHHLIMGRKTYESIGKPLPGRTMIVLSHEVQTEGKDLLWVHSIEDALKIARNAGDDQAFIIGGGQIFKQALPLADRLYLTRVHATPDGDTFFPQINPKIWLMTRKASYPASERDEFSYTFIDYRKQPKIKKNSHS